MELVKLSVQEVRRWFSLFTKPVQVIQAALLYFHSLFGNLNARIVLKLAMFVTIIKISKFVSSVSQQHRLITMANVFKLALKVLMEILIRVRNAQKDHQYV